MMMEIPIRELKYSQALFLNAFLSQEYKFLLYAGSVNTGKTYISATILVALADEYPNSRFAIIRRSMTTIRRTTYQTFKKVLNEYKIKFKENKFDMRIELQNGSTLEFIEADKSKDPDLNKVKGLEVTAMLLDEANEVVEGVFNIAMTRIGRWNSNGCPSFIFLTCNPNVSWVKTIFYDKWKDGKLNKPFFFQQNSIKEIPPESLAILKNLPKAEYDRYALGKWDWSDDPNQLIRYEWIHRNLCDWSEPNALGIDVAREGNDRTIFAYRMNSNIVKLEVIKDRKQKLDLITTGDIAINRMTEYHIKDTDVSVDVVGVGGGTYDYLLSKGKYVNPYDSRNKPTEDASILAFQNMRAQSYWKLRSALEKDEWKLVEDAELIMELTNLRYYVDGRTIRIEEKIEFKRRMEFSPDKADAVVISYNNYPPNLIDATSGGKLIEFDTKPQMVGADGRGIYLRELRKEREREILGF
jgi:hypothetical protein